MKKSINNTLIAQYQDPYGFVEKSALAAMRRQHLKELLVRAGIGLAVLLALVILGNSHDYTPRSRNDIEVGLIVVGIPIYVLYGLFTTRRAVIAIYRQQLAKAHPELCTLERSQYKVGDRRLAPRLITALWIILALVIVIVVVATTLTD